MSQKSISVELAVNTTHNQTLASKSGGVPVNLYRLNDLKRPAVPATYQQTEITPSCSKVEYAGIALFCERSYKMPDFWVGSV
jgi:hypothetical protein